MATTTADPESCPLPGNKRKCCPELDVHPKKAAKLEEIPTVCLVDPDLNDPDTDTDSDSDLEDRGCLLETHVDRTIHKRAKAFAAGLKGIELYKKGSYDAAKPLLIQGLDQGL